MTKELNISTSAFEQEVLLSDIPVLVDFWAAWCTPCKALAPHLMALANEYQDRLKIIKVNVDANMKISQDFSISSIPTLLLFKDGQIVARRSGATGGLPALRALISPHIATTSRSYTGQ